MTAKTTLLRHLHELTEQLEQDQSSGECLPSGLLASLECELSTCNRFMEKRKQRRPCYLSVCHNTPARVRLN